MSTQLVITVKGEHCGNKSALSVFTDQCLVPNCDILPNLKVVQIKFSTASDVVIPHVVTTLIKLYAVIEKIVCLSLNTPIMRYYSHLQYFVKLQEFFGLIKAYDYSVLLLVGLRTIDLFVLYNFLTQCNLLWIDFNILIQL